MLCTVEKSSITQIQKYKSNQMHQSAAKDQNKANKNDY